MADCTNRFPLSFQVRDKWGASIFESRFESIDFEPTFEEGFLHKRRHGKVPSWIRISSTPITADRLAKEAGFPVWIPRDPPKGFQIVSSEMVRVTTTLPSTLSAFAINLQILHVMYTDGMALFALVEFPADHPAWKMFQNCLSPVKTDGGTLARRFRHAEGAALIVEMGQTVVLLAGNLPSEELEISARTLIRGGSK